MRLSILLFFCMAFCIRAGAQDAFIKGRIIDASTKETLPGVSVVIDETSGTAADINGNFIHKVTAGKHKVTFNLVGYRQQVNYIDAKAGDTLVLNAHLEQLRTELDVVVVSAGKFEQKLSDVTVSMEVIKSDLLEERNTTNMETMIDQVPGVNVVDGQANIRGGSGFSYGAGSRVMLLVDELPMITADAGDVKWNYLPMENCEQVEVIKGASSALFGSSALNGAINIRTAYPRDTAQTKINIYSALYDDPKREELIWWSSNPVYKGGEIMHSRKIKNFDVVVGGHYFDDDGYRELETEERLRLNANLRYRFKNTPGLSAGINFNTMGTRGGLFLLWQDADSGAYRPSGGEIQVYKNRRSNIDPFVTYYTVSS